MYGMTEFEAKRHAADYEALISNEWGSHSTARSSSRLVWLFGGATTLAFFITNAGIF